MAVKKGAGSPGSSKPGAAKKIKQPTQRTALERVMVLGPTGKRRFEWRVR